MEPQEEFKGEIISSEYMIQLFEKIQEMVEVSSQNNVNLCYLGGLQALFEIVITGTRDDVRKAACRLINSVVSNNINV